MEGHDILLAEGGNEQPAFNLAGGHVQQQKAVLGLQRRPEASQVKHTLDLALGVSDRHGGTGEDAQPVEEMLAVTDHCRSPFHQRSTECVGPTHGLAPTGSLLEISQFPPLAAATFNRQHCGLGVHQNQQAVITVVPKTVSQVLQSRLGTVEQHAIALVQLINSERLWLGTGRLGVGLQAVAHAALPGSANWLTQGKLLGTPSPGRQRPLPSAEYIRQFLVELCIQVHRPSIESVCRLLFYEGWRRFRSNPRGNTAINEPVRDKASLAAIETAIRCASGSAQRYRGIPACGQVFHIKTKSRTTGHLGTKTGIQQMELLGNCE